MTPGLNFTHIADAEWGVFNTFRNTGLKPRPDRQALKRLCSPNCQFRNLPPPFHLTETRSAFGHTWSRKRDVIEIAKVWDETFDAEDNTIEWHVKSIQLLESGPIACLKPRTWFEVEYHARFRFTKSQGETYISDIETLVNRRDPIEGPEEKNVYGS